MYYLTDDPPDLIQRALTAHLYQKSNTGGLLSLFERAQQSIAVIDTISLAHDEQRQQDVGVATLDRRGLLMCYVKPSHRRKHVGAGLVDALLQTTQSDPASIWAWYGPDSRLSKQFWTKLGIYLPQPTLTNLGLIQSS